MLTATLSSLTGEGCWLPSDTFLSYHHHPHLAAWSCSLFNTKPELCFICKQPVQVSFVQTRSFPNYSRPYYKIFTYSDATVELKLTFCDSAPGSLTATSGVG